MLRGSGERGLLLGRRGPVGSVCVFFLFAFCVHGNVFSVAECAVPKSVSKHVVVVLILGVTSFGRATRLVVWAA